MLYRIAMKSSPFSTLLLLALFLVALVAGANENEMNAVDIDMNDMNKIEMDAMNDVGNEVRKVSAIQLKLNIKS